MKLTGKAKKDFEWYYDSLDIPHYYINVDFDTLPKSMQYGVYVDWFDSVDFILRIQDGYDFSGELEYWGSISGSVIRDKSNIHKVMNWKTRPEARTAAIEKANEIYNNN